MGSKHSINLSLDSELIAKARALGINISQALEPKLREIVLRREAEEWAERNREAIERYNHRITEYGPIGEEYGKYG